MKHGRSWSPSCPVGSELGHWVPEEPLCICAVPQWDLLCLSPVQGYAERLFGRDFRDSRALGLCPPFQISRREGRGSGAAVCVLLDPPQGVAFST